MSEKKKKRYSEGKLYTFEVWHEWSEDHPRQYVARTPGKAKYKDYVYMLDVWDVPFKEYLEGVHCKDCGIFGPGQQHPDSLNSILFSELSEKRGIPFAELGMTVEVSGLGRGIIVGGNSSMNLDVIFEGKDYPSNCHPWHEIVYYDNRGGIIRDYREATR